LSVEIKDRWERVEGLHFGPPVSWLELVVDPEGNLITSVELEVPGLPSQAAPKILAARTGTDKRGEPSGRNCWAGPVALLGRDPWVTGEWSTGSTVRDEFNLLDLPMREADEDRTAGFVRIRELLRLDPSHKFPEGHPRAGEPGSPGLFLNGCPRLREQLSSAPVEADDEPLPRAAVSQRWEQADGGLVAALRYAVLSRPSPSEKPKPWITDMRDRGVRDFIDQKDNLRSPRAGVDYE
jgi:hypothetical protein